MREIKIESSVMVYEDYSTFSEQEIKLFEKAIAACKTAYAPYSQFYVGASVLLENGEIIVGNNQENAVYPCGLCAERVALFNAATHYPEVSPKLLAVTIDYDRVASEDIAFPCGSCRQVISEFEYRFKTPITLYMLGKGQQVYKLSSVKQLLPFTFTPDNLK